jgi:transcriptional regulator with XRE-family HTH domain
VKHDPEKEVVKNIIRQLIEQRKKGNISQQRLSEMAGISRTGLRHIESLETNPTLYSLLKLSQALDLPLSTLLRKAGH